MSQLMHSSAEKRVTNLFIGTGDRDSSGGYNVQCTSTMGPCVIKGYRREEIFLSPMSHPVPKVGQQQRGVLSSSLGLEKMGPGCKQSSEQQQKKLKFFRCRMAGHEHAQRLFHGAVGGPTDTYVPPKVCQHQFTHL